MSTAYAIIRTNPLSDHHPEVRVVQVVWREEQAEEMVNRLNALASGPGPYSWQAAWVARPDPDAGASLTPRDREQLELARTHRALDTERPVTVFFSFIFNRTGALAACEELRGLGWPEADADEEATDDECWHVYGLGRRLVLSEVSITRLRTEMEDLAERHGGTFDGWDVTGVGLRWTEPGKLPT